MLGKICLLRKRRPSLTLPAGARRPSLTVPGQVPGAPGGGLGSGSLLCPQRGRALSIVLSEPPMMDEDDERRSGETFVFVPRWFVGMGCVFLFGAGADEASDKAQVFEVRDILLFY